MEKIDLPEKEIINAKENEPESPHDMHIQSLLHAVSNKDKIREDVDSIPFMREANRSRSRKREKLDPVNIFTHLKNMSDKIIKRAFKLHIFSIASSHFRFKHTA